MAERPKTSTVRTALSIAEQFEDLLRPGRRGEPMDPWDLADALATIIRASRDLQAYQVDDVVSHLHTISTEEPTPKVARDARCAECNRDMAEDTAHFCAGCWNAQPWDQPMEDLTRAADGYLRPSWEQPYEDGPGPEHAEPSWEQDAAALRQETSFPDIGDGEETIKPEDPREDADEGHDRRETADQLAARVRGDDEQAAAGP